MANLSLSHLVSVVVVLGLLVAIVVVSSAVLGGR